MAWQVARWQAHMAGKSQKAACYLMGAHQLHASLTSSDLLNHSGMARQQGRSVYSL